eukprot:366345-Chlamydomonas_euryale.AAC.16
MRAYKHHAGFGAIMQAIEPCGYSKHGAGLRSTTQAWRPSCGPRSHHACHHSDTLTPSAATVMNRTQTKALVQGPVPPETGQALRVNHTIDTASTKGLSYPRRGRHKEPVLPETWQAKRACPTRAAASTKSLSYQRRGKQQGLVLLETR